jgi:ubiquinone/menaquinone biosynthesis C-methylase UbiE
MVETPLYLYSAARAAHFTIQFDLLQGLAGLLEPRSGKSERAEVPMDELRKALFALLRQDSRNIAQGLYPAAVLAPESPVRHLLRLPLLVADGVGLFLRRQRGRTTAFSRQARGMLDELPRYYRRNFHFQTDGYLSERSASLYEHQVEILFRGTADAMRRLILPPLKKQLGRPDGRGLRILELACGTGRATRFTSLALPRARIVGLDLSEAYLKVARERLSDLTRVDFLQGDAGQLPFADGQFDAVYSVFLFHELPMAERRRVLAEARRVLKPGGFLGLVDSIQLGDHAAFDPLLKQFPKDYHEPFYRDYSEHPMEALVADTGLEGVQKDTGFFSKVVWAEKT